MGLRITQQPKQHQLNVRSLSKYMKDAANDFRARTVNRTRKGLDINDKPFQEYSQDYGDEKAKIGAGRTVNLIGSYGNAKRRDSGSGLLASLHVEAGASYAKIYPTAHSAIGYYHNTGSGVPKREWFAINNVIKESIMRILSKAVRFK